MRHCLCPPDGSSFCLRCQLLADRAGVALKSPSKAQERAGRNGVGKDTNQRAAQPGGSEESETGFLGRVLALARLYGWTFYHTHDSRKSPEGFPDIVLVRDVVIFAELKTRVGKLTMQQAVWLEMLRHTGQVEVYLWRPAQWEEVQKRLSAPANKRRAS